MSAAQRAYERGRRLERAEAEGLIRGLIALRRSWLVPNEPPKVRLPARTALMLAASAMAGIR
jgi:hypothetical protein